MMLEKLDNNAEAMVVAAVNGAILQCLQAASSRIWKAELG